MEEDYNPSRREVFREMSSGMSSGSRKVFNGVFSKKSVLRIGKEFKDFVIFGGVILGAVSTLPYYIPTVAREIKSPLSYSYRKYSLGENIGGWVGFFGGVALDIGQVYSYHYLATHNHPEVLVIPVVANVISGGYELSRIGWRNAKKRLVEKHKKELSDIS